MDKNIVQKNIEYQKDVKNIAKMLFHAFYYDEEELKEELISKNPDLAHFHLSKLPGTEIYEEYMIVALLEKADKFFQFFSSVDDAKKTIQFLQTVNPHKAKEILDEM